MESKSFRGHKLNRPVTGVLLLFVFVLSGFSGDLTIHAGGSYNKRYGAYFFDRIEKRVERSRENLFMPGVKLGFRYNNIDNYIRLELLYSLKFGLSREDTLIINNQRETVETVFRDNAFDLHIHIIADKSPNPTVFFLIHCGAGIMHIEEATGYSDINMIDDRCFYPFAGAGLGFDFNLKKLKIGAELPLINIARPVSYEHSRDMPLESVYYREVFLYLEFNLVIQIIS